MTTKTVQELVAEGLLSEEDARFVDALVAAVEERGLDYVYPDEWREGTDWSPTGQGRCQYTVDGHGACLVGLAIEKFDGEPWTSYNEQASEILPQLASGEHFTQSFLEAVDEAQSAQDIGGSWAYALAQLFEALERNLEGVTLERPIVIPRPAEKQS